MADIDILLERGDNQDTSPPAPPQGLYFVERHLSSRSCYRGPAVEGLHVAAREQLARWRWP